MTLVLSDRQMQVVALIECGADSETIAEELGIAQWTVRDVVRKLRSKLGAESMRAIPAAARAHGVELPPCDD